MEAGEKVIHKQHPSAFTATELDNYLTNDVKSKKIVLVGYMVLPPCLPSPFLTPFSPILNLVPPAHPSNAPQGPRLHLQHLARGGGAGV